MGGAESRRREASLYEAWAEAKAWALRQMRLSGVQRLVLFWPTGIEPMRSTLAPSVEQRFLEATMPVEKLFAPTAAWSE